MKCILKMRRKIREISNNGNCCAYSSVDCVPCHLRHVSFSFFTSLHHCSLIESFFLLFTLRQNTHFIYLKFKCMNIINSKILFQHQFSEASEQRNMKKISLLKFSLYRFLISSSNQINCNQCSYFDDQLVFLSFDLIIQRKSALVFFVNAFENMKKTTT